MNKDKVKAEVFNAFFIFPTGDGLRRRLGPELEDHGCENDKLPVSPELVQDLLLQLDPYEDFKFPFWVCIKCQISSNSKSLKNTFSY